MLLPEMLGIILVRRLELVCQLTITASWLFFTNTNWNTISLSQWWWFLPSWVSWITNFDNFLKQWFNRCLISKIQYLFLYSTKTQDMCVLEQMGIWEEPWFKNQTKGGIWFCKHYFNATIDLGTFQEVKTFPEIIFKKMKSFRYLKS